MTLDNLANIYQHQLLDTMYFMFVEYPKSLFVINSNKSNFMHLTGLQRCAEFKHYKPSGFFDFCLHDSREVSSLNFTTRADRNMVLLKTNTFDNCYKAIHNPSSIYVSNKNLICVTMCTNNGKIKLFSIAFVQDRNDTTWHPATIQVDKNRESSVILKSARPIIITKVQEANKRGVLEAMRKNGKTLEDVKNFFIKRVI